MTPCEPLQQRAGQGAQPDGFAMVVSLPHVPVRPCASNRSPTPASRAPRFITQLPLTFRLPDGRGWHHGVSENISRSGILFRTDRTATGSGWDDSAPHGTRVDVVFEVATDSEPQRTRHVECEGRLVRTHGTDAARTPVSIAVAVLSYAVVPASPETSLSPESAPRGLTSPAREARTDAPRSVQGGAAKAVRSPRRSSRVAIGMQGQVTAEVNSYRREHTSVAGRIVSLSPTGAFLELGGDYPIGSALNLLFRLPPLFATISCAAVVRSHRPGRGIGVEFVELARQDREHIEKFVAGRGPVRRSTPATSTSSS